MCMLLPFPWLSAPLPSFLQCFFVVAEVAFLRVLLVLVAVAAVVVGLVVAVLRLPVVLDVVLAVLAVALLLFAVLAARLPILRRFRSFGHGTVHLAVHRVPFGYFLLHHPGPAAAVVAVAAADLEPWVASSYLFRVLC